MHDLLLVSWNFMGFRLKTEIQGELSDFVLRLAGAWVTVEM